MFEKLQQTGSLMSVKFKIFIFISVFSSNFSSKFSAHSSETILSSKTLMNLQCFLLLSLLRTYWALKRSTYSSRKSLCAHINTRKKRAPRGCRRIHIGIRFFFILSFSSSPSRFLFRRSLPQELRIIVGGP